jgi:hypothetical protein
VKLARARARVDTGMRRIAAEHRLSRAKTSR